MSDPWRRSGPAAAAGCIFCAIANGAAPADIVLETDDLVAFRDVKPAAPVHLLVVPRRHVESVHALDKRDAALLLSVFSAIWQLAELEGVVESGYRVVLNHGPDTAGVAHLHAHMLGGRRMVGLHGNDPG